MLEIYKRSDLFGPFPVPQTERQEIMQQLWVLRVIIPGADELEVSQLRDYLLWQIDAELQRRKNPRAVLTVNVPLAKEVIAWRKKKGIGTRG